MKRMFEGAADHVYYIEIENGKKICGAHTKFWGDATELSGNLCNISEEEKKKGGILDDLLFKERN